MFKYFLFGFLGLLIFFSGCITNAQDLEQAMMANSAISSFKAAHPNAQFSAILWNDSDLQTNSNKVMNICGKTLIGEYYYFNMTENNDIIEGFSTKENYDLVCVKSYKLNEEYSDNNTNDNLVNIGESLDTLNNQNIEIMEKADVDAFSATIKVEGRNDWGEFPEIAEVSLITQDGDVLETKKLVDKKAEFTITNNTPPFIIISSNGAIASTNPEEGYGVPAKYGWRYEKLVKVDNELFLERIDDGSRRKITYPYLLYVIKPNLIDWDFCVENDDFRKEVQVLLRLSPQNSILDSEKRVVLLKTKDGTILDSKETSNGIARFVVKGSYPEFYAITQDNAYADYDATHNIGIGQHYWKLKKCNREFNLTSSNGYLPLTDTDYRPILLYPTTELINQEYFLTIKSTYNQGNMTTVPYLLFSYGCDLDNVIKLARLAYDKRAIASSTVEDNWSNTANLGLNREYLDIDEGEGDCEFVYYYAFDPTNKIIKNLPSGKYVLGLFKKPVWFSDTFTTSSYSFISSDYGIINNDYDAITVLEFELNSNKEINISVEIN